MCEKGLMRGKFLKPRTLSVLLIMITVAWGISEGYAGPVIKEIIVDKEGRGDFQSITEALSAITDASETKRYRIQVNPGIYTEQVVMKSHVDISGSGQESTTISYDADGPTIRWPAQDASLENITLTGKGRELMYIDGSAIVRNTKIVISYSSQNGIATSSNASLELSGSQIIDDSVSGGATGIFFDKGILLVEKSFIEIGSASATPSQGIIAERAEKAVVKGSLITIEGNGYGITAKNTDIIESNISVKSPESVINDVIGIASWGNVSIIGSEITATAKVPSRRTVAVDVSGENTIIRNSLVSSDFYGIRINRGLLEVKESTVSGKSLGLTKSKKGVFNISNSRITGGHDGKKGIDTITNSIDENNKPINMGSDLTID